MGRCYKGGTKHKYKPRYDELDQDSGMIEARGVMGPNAMRRMGLRDVYVRDICVWCGKTIERKDNG